jgi:hypothetical protein
MDTAVIIQLLIEWLSNYCKLGTNKVIKLEFRFFSIGLFKLEISVNLFYVNLNISQVSIQNE